MSGNIQVSESSLKALRDVFLWIDQACSDTDCQDDSSDLSVDDEDDHLNEINRKITFYQSCFKKMCEDQPSRQRHYSFSFGDMVPRFSNILREFVLSHQWSEAVRWVHAISKEIKNSDNVIWKLGLECLIQNGNPQLIRTFTSQVSELRSITCVEVLLDYLLHLLTLGDFLTGKELITDLKVSDKRNQNVLSNERRKEAFTLFHAYQGLLLYLEWKASVMHEDSDDEFMKDFTTPVKMHNTEFARNTAEKALELLLSVKDVDGVWDIFLFKAVAIYEYYNSLDEARSLLKSYREKNPLNPNSHKYLYEFENRNGGDSSLMTECLQSLVKLDPCNSHALTLYTLLKSDNPESISILFNFLDYDNSKEDELCWKLFAERLSQIYEASDVKMQDAVSKCWDSRKDWWPLHVLLTDSNCNPTSSTGKQEEKSSLVKYKQKVRRILNDIGRGVLETPRKKRKLKHPS